MSESIEHVPSAEFVDSLEARVVSEFRYAQSLSRMPPGLLRKRGVRTTLTLVTGLAIGAGTMVASAQVRSSQQRDSLLTEIDSKRVVAAMRLEIAKATQKEILTAVGVGVRSEADAYQAQHDVMAAQFALKRIDLDIEEVQASSMPPRDELWAPLVGKRDFVLERLNADLAAWTDKSAQNNEKMTRFGARMRSGLIAEASDTDFSLSYEQVEVDATTFLLAHKRQMREQFLKGSLTEKEISSRIALMETQQALKLLITKVQLATQRVQRAKDRSGVGVGSEIDVKRAELEVLETNQDLLRIREQLKRLEAIQAAAKKN